MQNVVFAHSLHYCLFPGVTVRVYVTDIEKDVIVEPPSSVRAYLTQTVAEFKELVSQVLTLSPLAVNFEDR